MKLTTVERRCLSAVRRLLKRGYSPSVRELAAECGWSSARTAWQVLNQLERKGQITRAPGTARSVRLAVGS